MCLVEKYPNARVNLIARRRLVSHKKQQIRGRSTGVTKTASAKGVGRQRPPAGGDSGGAGPRKNGTFSGARVRASETRGEAATAAAVGGPTTATSRLPAAYAQWCLHLFNPITTHSAAALPDCPDNNKFFRF